MAKTAQKPKDMHRSVRATVKQVFNPKTTRFLASKSDVRGRGFLGYFTGIQSKTQKLAWKAQKEVLGNQSAVNIAKISFKQQAYKDALAAKIAKVQGRADDNPFGKRTKLFSMPARRQAKAQRKIALLQKKVAHYNAQANSAIKQLATTKLGQTTLQRNKVTGTLVQKSLAGAMDELKKAYNAKTSGAIDAKKTKLAQIIKTKQGLDNKVISARSAVYMNPSKETKAALQLALAEKDKFIKSPDAQEISKLVKSLKKTNKISQIKFNNLYAVGKGTTRGQEIKAKAKTDVLTMTNSAKQLKQEAKYSSYSKIANRSFYQKYIKGKPLYTSVEGQTKLKSIVDEAAAIKLRMKTPGSAPPTSSEIKILKRSLKAQAILRTLGRSSITAANGTKKNLLRIPISAEILKSPLTKYGTDILAKKAILDEAKVKADDATASKVQNAQKIASLDNEKIELEAKTLELGQTKTQLADKMKLFVPEALTKQKEDLESKIPRDEVAIKAIDDQIAKTVANLTPEQQKEHTQLGYDIKLNENQITTNSESIGSINAQKISIEAENKTHDETIKTHTTKESEYKIEDATIKLTANKEIIAGYDSQIKALNNKIALATTTPEAALAIRTQIDAIGQEKIKLETENKVHTDIITPKVVATVATTAQPQAPTPVLHQTTQSQSPKIKTTQPLTKQSADQAVANLKVLYDQKGFGVPPQAEIDKIYAQVAPAPAPAPEPLKVNPAAVAPVAPVTPVKQRTKEEANIERAKLLAQIAALDEGSAAAAVEKVVALPPVEKVKALPPVEVVVAPPPVLVLQPKVAPSPVEKVASPTVTQEKVAPTSPPTGLRGYGDMPFEEKKAPKILSAQKKAPDMGYMEVAIDS